MPPGPWVTTPLHPKLICDYFESRLLYLDGKKRYRLVFENLNTVDGVTSVFRLLVDTPTLIESHFSDSPRF